jgi:hypothetical protein
MVADHPRITGRAHPEPAAQLCPARDHRVAGAAELDADRPRPDRIAWESNRAPFDRVPVPR